MKVIGKFTMINLRQTKTKVKKIIIQIKVHNVTNIDGVIF